MKNNDGSYTAMEGAYNAPPPGYGYPAAPQPQYGGAYQPGPAYAPPYAGGQYAAPQPKYGGAYQPSPAYTDPYGGGSQTTVLVKATSAEPVVEAPSYSEMMDKHVRLG